MQHFFGPVIARGGNAVSRQGPDSGIGRGQAPGARVGTCAGTGGRGCQGAAALYRAALSELAARPPADSFWARSPHTQEALGIRGPGCPARCGFKARGAEAPTRPLGARALLPTCPIPAVSAGQGRKDGDARRTPSPDVRNRMLTRVKLLVSSARPGGSCVL